MSDEKQPGAARRKIRRGLDGLILLCASIFVWRVAVIPSNQTEVNSGHARIVQYGVPLSDIGCETSLDGSPIVVLFARTTCPICAESIPFYHRLSTGLERRAGVRFAVVSAEDEGVVRTWLKENVIDADEVIFIDDPAAVGLTLTPTLLVADSRGMVTDVIIGKISAADEARLWDRLLNPISTVNIDNSHAGEEIDEAEFMELLVADDQTQVLDVRGRGVDGRGGTRGYSVLRMPLNELQQRAPIELYKSVPTVVDCTDASIVTCRAAATALRRLKFSYVAIYSSTWRPASRATPLKAGLTR